eukprot:6199279-Pleurochrysis_carterae.AAC.2
MKPGSPFAAHLLAPLGTDAMYNGTHAQLTAQLKLLRAGLALTDPPADIFLLLSEKSIPRASFATIHEIALRSEAMSTACSPATLTITETSGPSAVWGYPLSDVSRSTPTCVHSARCQP